MANIPIVAEQFFAAAAQQRFHLLPLRGSSRVDAAGEAIACANPPASGAPLQILQEGVGKGTEKPEPFFRLVLLQWIFRNHAVSPLFSQIRAQPPFRRMHPDPESHLAGHTIRQPPAVQYIR